MSWLKPHSLNSSFLSHQVVMQPCRWLTKEASMWNDIEEIFIPIRYCHKSVPVWDCSFFPVGRAFLPLVPVEDNEVVTLLPLALSILSLSQHWRGEGKTVWSESCSHFAFVTKGGPSKVITQQGWDTGNCMPELAVYEGLKRKEQNGPEKVWL